LQILLLMSQSSSFLSWMSMAKFCSSMTQLQLLKRQPERGRSSTTAAAAAAAADGPASPRGRAIFSNVNGFIRNFFLYRQRKKVDLPTYFF
jgi:hypothetical protein